MAAIEPATDTIAAAKLEFAYAVARNIRTVANWRGIRSDAAIGRLIGLSRGVIGTRLAGETEWNGSELDRLGQRLECPDGMLLIKDEAEFREAMARSIRCFSAVADVSGVQTELMDHEGRLLGVRADLSAL